MEQSLRSPIKYKVDRKKYKFTNVLSNSIPLTRRITISVTDMDATDSSSNEEDEPFGRRLVEKRYVTELIMETCNDKDTNAIQRLNERNRAKLQNEEVVDECEVKISNAGANRCEFLVELDKFFQDASSGGHLFGFETKSLFDEIDPNLTKLQDCLSSSFDSGNMFCDIPEDFSWLEDDCFKDLEDLVPI